MLPSRNRIFLWIEPRCSSSVPILRPAEIHCRISGRPIVLRLPDSMRRRGPSGPFPGHVPVQEAAPALRRSPGSEAHGQGRRQERPARVTDETQPGLLGRTVALLAVAADATGDDV